MLTVILSKISTVIISKNYLTFSYPIVPGSCECGSKYVNLKHFLGLDIYDIFK